MKKFLPIFLILACSVRLNAQETAPVAYEYKMFTVIESVIAGGLGRSRLLETDNNGQMRETELEHLFSIGGIHMKNIHSNDKLITLKINEYARENWTLDEVAPGVYSREGQGIYLTRYVFKRPRTQ